MSAKKRKFILSNNSSINSKGFRVDVNGIDLRRFENNPIMLYEHDNERVIGRWTDIEKTDAKLLAMPQFDEGDEFAMGIAGKVERGYINGASIGIIVKDIETINGVDVVTHCELYEASVVSVPADASAVQLYNEKLECLNIETIKLSMNKKKRLNDEGKTDYKALYAEICDALGLTPDKELDDVLKAIELLMNPQAENEIKEALRLGIINDTEMPYYQQLSKNGNANIIDLLSVKKREHEKAEKIRLGEYFRTNNEKITTYIGLDGWENVRKMGYEFAKNLIDKLPNRITFSTMIKDHGASGGEIRNLSWYRKNDPKALQENPELFKQLLNDEKREKTK